jgi:hypothetical protein
VRTPRRRSASGVNQGAGETGTASAQVLPSAREFARESNRLKLDLANLLATLRAARRRPAFGAEPVDASRRSDRPSRPHAPAA